MIHERRRSPRTEVAHGTVGLHRGFDVRVLDLSLSGVLLQTTRPVEPGTPARLRLKVEGTSFVAEIAIRRVAPLPDGRSGFRIGAEFMNVSAETRQLIESLIAAP